MAHRVRRPPFPFETSGRFVSRQPLTNDSEPQLAGSRHGTVLRQGRVRKGASNLTNTLSRGRWEVKNEIQTSFHCSQAGSQHAAGAAARVADCSQAGIDYTGWPRAPAVPRVADCSQAGIDYTAGSMTSTIPIVADCSQAGIDYT